MSTHRELRGREAGFALILAILALMLLTFLGLTLATTTSTELQISNNYRWSQQALYNAEAGLEVGRALLARVGDPEQVLPGPRTTPWNPDAITPPVTAFTGWLFPATRNGENGWCDYWGNGMGFGQVLVNPSNPGAPFENVRNPFGITDQELSGTFTIWVRRELVMNPGPAFTDNPVGANLIVTAEGSAPFRDDGDFQRANRSIRRLESVVSVTEGCRTNFNSESATGFRACEE